MTELHLPWLEFSVLIPLLGAICVSRIRDRDQARRVSIGACLITVTCTCGEWFDFVSLNRFEAHDQWDPFQLLFQREGFVIDELSAPPLSGACR